MIRYTWPMPVLIATVSLIGLLVALTGDGWYDVVSWWSLGTPIAAVIGAYYFRKR